MFLKAIYMYSNSWMQSTASESRAFDFWVSLWTEAFAAAAQNNERLRVTHGLRSAFACFLGNHMMSRT